MVLARNKDSTIKPMIQRVMQNENRESISIYISTVSHTEYL